MNIIVAFESRSYVFESHDDAAIAQYLYAFNTGTLDNFEDELKENFINFNCLLTS